jgi:SAM-dependent methyltransferase
MPLKLEDAPEALELFPDYDSSRPESVERIVKRARSMQEKYGVLSRQTRHRMLEDDNIGVPRITKFDFYPLVKGLLGPGKAFVDGGCGMGSDLRKVIRDGADPRRAIGITWKPEEIDWGYELYGDRHDPGHSGRYLVCDLRNLELKQESVDFFNNISIIHTLGKKEDVLRFLSEAKRVLKPEGLLFGITLGNFAEAEEPYYQISKEALRSYMKELGFHGARINEHRNTKPISFRYVSSGIRSDEERLPPEPVRLHYLAKA